MREAIEAEPDRARKGKLGLMGARSDQMEPDMFVADLYCEIGTPARETWRHFWPGIIAVLLALMTSEFIAEHYGMPATLAGLLISLALGFPSSDGQFQPGLEFSTSTLPRLGIVLAGARVTIGQVVGMGPLALGCLLLIVGITIASGALLARFADFSRGFGILAGSAVAICGASAAVAAVLGGRRANKAEPTVVLIGISLLSAMATMLYPSIARLFRSTDLQAGFFLGTSIHDIAQAMGADFAFSDAAGQSATIVKLAR